MSSRESDRGLFSDREPSQRRRLVTRSSVIPILLVLLFAGLVAALSYTPQQEPAVHYHLSFRIYADGERIWFPSFNYAYQDGAAHVHDHEPAVPGRADELVHVHEMNPTFGAFLTSFGAEVAPGGLRLDDPWENPRSVHENDTFEDNVTHAWRFFRQPSGGEWVRVAGDPVEYGSHVLTPGERILLTFVPRSIPDDDPLLAWQKESVLDGLDGWDQIAPAAQ